jgi:hypothetical protein
MLDVIINDAFSGIKTKNSQLKLIKPYIKGNRELCLQGELDKLKQGNSEMNCMVTCIIPS